MADDMTPAYDLESDQTPNFAAQTPADTEPQTPPAEAPPAQEPTPADEPEGAIEVQGGKYVPLQALKATREELRTAKERAAKLDELSESVRGWAPYVNFLQAHPEIMTGQRATTAPQGTVAEPATSTTGTPAKPTLDPLAERLAQRLDLYTADGKPDTTRGQELLTIINEVADERSRRAVEPLNKQQHYDRSVANYNHVLNTVKTPDGHTADAGALAEVWRSMPVEYTSDPRVARVLALAVIGDATVAGKYKPPVPPPPNPPLETEAVGGRVPANVTLTPLEQQVARSRGMNNETWAKRTEGFKPGGPSVLED